MMGLLQTNIEHVCTTSQNSHCFEKLMMKHRLTSTHLLNGLYHVFWSSHTLFGVSHCLHLAKVKLRPIGNPQIFLFWKKKKKKKKKNQYKHPEANCHMALKLAKWFLGYWSKNNLHVLIYNLKTVCPTKKLMSFLWVS